MASLTLGRGMHNTLPAGIVAGSPMMFGWTNHNFGAGTAYTDPIQLLLQLLISAGAGDNYSGSGTNYDVFEPGVGLGIPQSRIDIASFEAVRAQFDWDVNFRWVGLWLKPEEGSGVGRIGRVGRVGPEKGMPHKAKSLIDDEISKPLGLFVVTGNDGRIKLVRPKNPAKWHVSKANNSLPPGGGTMLVGIYNGNELAAQAAAALGANYTVTFNSGTNKFSVTNTAAIWSLSTVTAGWQTLGYNQTHSNVPQNTPLVSDVATGVFSGTTLSEADMWDVKQVANRGDQITSVVYEYDYDLAKDQFNQQREYLSAEDINIASPMGSSAFVIKAKGLGSSETNTTGNPMSHWMEQGGTCDPLRVLPPAGTGVDYDSITQLYSAMLLDRYKQPPLKFSAKLRWKHNTLEVGDVVQINYGINAVLVDRENDKTTISSRLFEIVQLTPNFKNGFLEATFLGHRNPTAPSVVVTARG